MKKMKLTTFEDIKAALWAGANTFRDNIEGIEDNLSNQFDALKDIGIKPVLEIESKSDVTQFLMDNIKMKLGYKLMQLKKLILD